MRKLFKSKRPDNEISGVSGENIVTFFAQLNFNNSPIAEIYEEMRQRWLELNKGAYSGLLQHDLTAVIMSLSKDMDYALPLLKDKLLGQMLVAASIFLLAFDISDDFSSAHLEKIFLAFSFLSFLALLKFTYDLFGANIKINALNQVAKQPTNQSHLQKLEQLITEFRDQINAVEGVKHVPSSRLADTNR